MYTRKNYKTKKEMKTAVAAGERVEVFQPGGVFPGRLNGRVTIEGPHYPEPHRWYSEVEIEDGYIVRVVS